MAISCQASFEILNLSFRYSHIYIYVIQVIISKFLWVRICECQIFLPNKIESFILISIGVKHLNFGSNKIVEPKKGQCSLAFLFQLVFYSLLVVLGIIMKLLVRRASTFLLIFDHFFGQLHKFFLVEGPFLLSFLESFLGFFINSQSLCLLLY